MTTIAIWMQAIRLRTLVITLSPVLIGSTLALKEGVFDLGIFILTLLTGLGVQISTNLADDYFDSLKENQPGNALAKQLGGHVAQSGLVSLAAIKLAVIMSCALTAILGSFLIARGGWIIGALLAIALVCALAYSGGPRPLSYLGLGDILVFLTFGPVATAATYFLQTSIVVPVAILCGIGPGFIAAAVLAICNLRDFEEDTALKKHTLIVRFGKTWGKWEYCLLILIAALLPLLFVQDHPAAIFASLILIPAWPLLRTAYKATQSSELVKLPPKTAQLLLLYSVLFSIGWVL